MLSKLCRMGIDTDIPWSSGHYSPLVAIETVAELEFDHDSVQVSVNELGFWVLSYTQAVSSVWIWLGVLPRIYGAPMVVLYEYHLDQVG